jgi:hypothetical protein
MINAPRRKNVFVKKFNNISLGSVTLRRSYLIVLRHSVSADVRSIYKCITLIFGTWIYGFSE